MPTFEIEQYELWSSKSRVEAKTEAEAIQKLLNGQGTPVDDSSELIEVADTYGLSAENEAPELAEALSKLGIRCDDIIPSIRSIEEV